MCYGQGHLTREEGGRPYIKEKGVWQSASSITVQGTMCHENAPHDTCVSPQYLREEGIYYQSRDPVMMAGLTKFSPGSINHTCPPRGGTTTRGPRRLCQQISHSQVSFLPLHQYKDEMMERGSDGLEEGKN